MLISIGPLGVSRRTVTWTLYKLEAVESVVTSACQVQLESSSNSPEVAPLNCSMPAEKSLSLDCASRVARDRYCTIFA